MKRLPIINHTMVKKKLIQKDIKPRKLTKNTKNQ